MKKFFEIKNKTFKIHSNKCNKFQLKKKITKLLVRTLMNFAH